jgi:hypothetical protein
VNVIWPAASETEPLAAPETAVTVSSSPSTSESLAVSEPAASRSGVSSSVGPALSSTASGPSLAAATVSETVAGALCRLASAAR